MMTTRKMPLIGVVGYFISEKEDFGGKVRGIPGQSFALFGHDMIMAIFNAGGFPVPLPVVDKKYIPQQIMNIDGLVFSGGEDIDPRIYGQTVRPTAHRMDQTRDQYEMELMSAALEANKPLLCVCRGMQLLNVHQGGTLCYDIKETTFTELQHWETKNPWESVHPVDIESGHFAEDVLGSTNLQVNSIHHQSIDRLGQGLEVVGKSPDGIVEAIALQDCDRVLAVQWHPELIAKKDPEGLRPFHWLVNAAIQSKK